MAKIDIQKIFGRGHCEDDSQKDRKWCYDLTIARNAQTQAPIVLREDIRQHGCTILGQENKKKKDILLTSIASDLNQKVCNDEARETELRKLIKKGRADYNMQKHAEGEKVIFKDSDVIPRPGCQKDYRKVLDRYPSCCVILVSPDKALCDEAARLAVSVGISPKYVDSSIKYDSKRYAEFGSYTATLNPFMMPRTRKNLTLKDAAYHAVQISKTTAAMIGMISPASQSGDLWTGFNDEALRVMVFLVVLYYNRVKACDVTWTEVLRVWNDVSELRTITAALEGLLDREDSSIPELPVALARAKDFLKNDGARFRDYTYPVRNTINTFLSDTHFGCLTSGRKCIDLVESFRTGDVIIVNSDIQNGKTASSVTGCVFQQMVRQAMFDRDIVPGSFPLPVIEYIDSLPTMGMYDWFEPMAVLGRKFGFWMVYAIETTTLLDTVSLDMGLQHLLLREDAVICLDREAVKELAVELPALAQAVSANNMMPDGNKIFLLTKNKPHFIDFQLGICSRQASGK